MGYKFNENAFGNTNRLAVYGLVAVIFVFAVVSLTSNNSQPAQPSGYLVRGGAENVIPVKSTSTSTQIDDVQKQLDRLKSDITSFSSNLTSCYSSAADLTGKLQSCSGDYALCRTDVAKLSANRSATEQLCENEKTKLQVQMSIVEDSSFILNKSLSTLTKDHESLKTKYTSLATNAANNLCCKAKVDNPKIGFYDIVSDKIVCTEGSGVAINC